MLVDPAFIKFTEVGFCEDCTALGLVHGGAEQVLHIMHRHDYRRTGRIKCAEQILAVAAHGALAVAALDIDGVLRQSRPVVRRNLQRCELVEVKQETDKNITPISNCAQCNNSA